jgi:hypothetical protein
MNVPGRRHPGLLGRVEPMANARFLLILVAAALASASCRSGETKAEPAPANLPAAKEWESQPSVLVVIYNPVIEARGGKKLTEVLGWNDPDGLVKRYAADVREASWGMVRYEIAERIERDEWPPLADGFRYTDESFLAMWEKRDFRPGDFDYVRMLEQNGVREKAERGKADEVWLLGFPGAIWCNGAVVENWKCKRAVTIMGFNYEREVDCMLEDLGHRAESVLAHVYGSWDAKDKHLWARFTRIEKTDPGESGCGSVHFAPNSEADYEWGNEKFVESACDDWLLNFPAFTGKKRKVNCAEWGGGDMRLHHIWWFRHLPRLEGKIEGKLANWWKYFIEWNRYGN